MKRRVFVLFVVALLPLILGPQTAPAAEPQFLFYLDAERLITLEFQITTDGQPVDKAWKKHLGELFNQIDKNQDGQIAGEERSHLPNTRILRGFNQPYTFRAPPAVMDRDQFQDYIETKLEFPPFRVSVERPTNQNRRTEVFLGMPNNSDDAARVLFSHLDRDSDGRLSREEMKGALRSLRKRDLDQDETIASAELVPVNSRRVFVNRTDTRTAQNATPFLVLGMDATSREVASQLTKKYDKPPGDNALSREELGVSRTLFAPHDVDGNGKWDFEEVQQYLGAPTADVVVKLHLGTQSKKKQPRIEFEHGDELDSKIRNAIGSLNLDNVQMEIAVRADSGGTIKDRLKRNFQFLDRDNNGYIDKGESQRLGNASAFFLDLDGDQDEKVFLEEWMAGLLPLAELMKRQIRLTVTDRGRDLFRILDDDGDSRISRREFWALPNRAALWDKDGDEQITLDEIPQQYRLVTSRGNFNFINRPLAIVDSPLTNRIRPNAVRNSEGPLWFQRMDRNRDGDLSRREFLGTRQDFQNLDTNQDGLISPREASLAK